MIYLDNAATSGTKPSSVIKAVNTALTRYSVNAGRGGYKRANELSEKIYKCRKKLALFFGADDETGVIFTQNCTTALNFVIKGVLKKGDHVVVSSFEHNAVMRPINELEKYGIRYSIAKIIVGDEEKTVQNFAEKIYPETKLVCCMHASNVTGDIFPIEKIGAICREKKVRFLVDAAQTAGIVNIDMKRMNIDYLCIAAHKGLYAPTGIGVLIARTPIEKTIIQGGTGTNSLEMIQPSDQPERFESGTMSVPLILGLDAGIDFLNSIKIDRLYYSEIKKMQLIYDNLKSINGVVFYSEKPTVNFAVPTLSFNINGFQSEEIADEYDKFGICVRAGLHCAPSAHKSIGTLDTGTVRISLSYFNTVDEIMSFLRITERIVNFRKK